MVIYTAGDRTPYTYLIGWSQHKKYYYGRRTAAGCHPNELWKTYFTSSDYVTQFTEKYGEPDIISIRKIFNSTEDCECWENKFLLKINAPTNPYFLNEHSGGATFSTTGKVAVKDANGNTFLISKNDPLWINKQVVALSAGRRASPEANAKKATAKGKVAVRDPNTNACYLVSKEDVRYINGELIPVGIGRVVSAEDRLKLSQTNKNKVVVRDDNGNVFKCSVDDPNFINGVWQQNTKGTCMAVDSSGKIFRASRQDPRWQTGEIVNPYKGKPNLKGRGQSKPKTLCPHCNKMISNNMIKRYHLDNCKHKSS